MKQRGHILHFHVISLHFPSMWDAFQMTASQREDFSFPLIGMEVYMSSIATPASWWEDKKLLV